MSFCFVWPAPSTCACTQLHGNGKHFVSFNAAGQYIIGNEGDIGQSSGFAFFPLSEENRALGLHEIDVPTHGVWEVADNHHKWHKHPDILIARGTGGTVRVSGRVGDNSHINGEYRSYERLCNHRFVYEKEGGAHVMYFLPETQQWHISSGADVCSDRCWAFVKPGTDLPIDDPDHSFGGWHVHSTAAGFAVDENVKLVRI